MPATKHTPEAKRPSVAALHGLRGEDMACRLLMALGYKVLGRNIRHGRAEMDILAQDGPYLVCVEVKARTSTVFGLPAQHITARKQELLNFALQEEMIKRGWQGPARFDEVSLVLLADGYLAEVYTDVWYG